MAADATIRFEGPSLATLPFQLDVRVAMVLPPMRYMTGDGVEVGLSPAGPPTPELAPLLEVQGDRVTVAAALRALAAQLDPG